MEVTFTEIEEKCVQQIAMAKDIPVESLTPETTLESIALDSLDRVTLAFDLEEQYDVEIPEAKLRQIVTVRDVAVAVEQALARKQQDSIADKGIA